jgi:hypothetical protein
MSNEETIGLDSDCEVRHVREHVNGPWEHEIAIPLAGALYPFAYVSPSVHRCGDISNGVSFRFSVKGSFGCGFVLPFEQLERWYLAAKNRREEIAATPVA